MSNERPPYHTISKVFKNQASRAERDQLASWVISYRANRLEYQKLKAIWEKYGQHHESYQVKADVAFEESLGKVSAEVNNQRLLFKVAAAITLLFLIGVTIYQLTPYWQETERVYTSTVDGKEVILPDGSMVVMRAGSKVTLAGDFDQQTRGLVLEGEAYFDVTKNRQKPFLVKSGSLTVEVLGTTFLVTPFGDQTEVALYTGEVEVYKSDQRLTLSPNETAIFRESLTKKRGINSNQLSWKTKLIDFQDEQLSQAFKILNKHYKINIQSSRAIGEKRLTASFNDQNIDEVLLIIASIHKLEIIKKDNKNYHLLEK